MKKLVVMAAVTLALGIGTAQAAGDAAKGKKVYKKCKACHTLKAGKNRVGPSLHGVIGRKAAAVPKYKYSKAMKNSGLVWDDANLRGYLKSPKKFLPKNKMAFRGLKKNKDIDNVLAYIAEQSK